MIWPRGRSTISFTSRVPAGLKSPWLSMKETFKRDDFISFEAYADWVLNKQYHEEQQAMVDAYRRKG